MMICSPRMLAAPVVLAAALTAPQPALADSFADAVASARPSVVAVLPQWVGRPANAEEPEGSGVVLGDGHHIATAAHVIGPAGDIIIRTHEGELLRAALVGSDRGTDIAVLRVARPLPAIEIEAASRAGGEVCALGNAFGLGVSSTCGTVSAVKVSGIGFNPVEDFIQTDAAVNPGASGGALVDENGRLVGLLSAIFTKTSDANIGVNFAVAAPLVARVVETLKTGEAVRWAVAAARFSPHPERGQEGLLGLRVDALIDESDAADRVQPGDVVLHVAGVRTRSRADLQAALSRVTDPGTVDARVLRAGERRTVQLPVIIPGL